MTNFSAVIRRFSRHISFIVWVLALGLAAWVGADLFWRMLAPRPAVFPVLGESNAGQAAQKIGARHLMGEAIVPVMGDVKRFLLFGVATGDGKRPGFAVLSTDGGAAQGFVAGQEIAPGVVLSSIFADHVEVNSGSGVRSISLQLSAIPVGGRVPSMEAFVREAQPSSMPGEVHGTPPATTVVPGS